MLDVSRSRYYKWKYKKDNPTEKELSRQFDLKLIREIHNKHKAHGYRWINAFLKNKYGVVFTNNYVHRLCKYADIKYQGKHYQWQKPDEENKKYNNLVCSGWERVNKPLQVIVSDMTAFWANKTYYKTPIQYKIESGL